MKVSVKNSAPSNPTPESQYLAQHQAQRGEVLAKACPSRGVLKHVTNSWGALALIVLQTKTHRFSELRRAIGGVSERMLTQTLQYLEQDGLVNRVAYEVVPPHVEYSLTALGEEVAGKVRGLVDWIEINLPRVLAAREQRDKAKRSVR